MTLPLRTGGLWGNTSSIKSLCPLAQHLKQKIHTERGHHCRPPTKSLCSGFCVHFNAGFQTWSVILPAHASHHMSSCCCCFCQNRTPPVANEHLFSWIKIFARCNSQHRLRDHVTFSSLEKTLSSVRPRSRPAVPEIGRGNRTHGGRSEVSVHDRSPEGK